MPIPVQITAIAGVLPEGFCPTGETALQEFYNKIIELTSWQLAANQVFYNYGNVVPTPENQVYPWIRTSGGYPDRMYIWAGGLWLSKHPLPEGATIIAPASLTSSALVDLFDEGEAGAVSLTTGPFWAIDSTFEGRVPIGAGAVPGSDPAVNLSVAAQTGAGSHELTQNELPSQINLSTELFGHRFNPENLAPLALAPRGSGGSYNTTPATETTTFQFTNADGNTPISLLPPVTARYIIKRTGRLYYKV